MINAATPGQGIATLLMRSTFKIQGVNSTGTGFVVGKPMPDNPARAFYVLVTAAHVLDGIPEDNATLHLRTLRGSAFARLPIALPIRSAGTPLWTTHPTVDVAAMYIAMPAEADIPLLPASLLATDETLDRFDLRPGDELLVLGYPYGAEGNDAGFPILRSGRIASYPLSPTGDTKSFLLDFSVFPGNSGGPVFMYHENRTYLGVAHIGVVAFIAGLISEEQNVKETITSLTEEVIKTHRLSLGVVIHARFLDDLIRSLPVPLGTS